MAGLLQGALGRASGEERQYDFTGAGTVLLQSSEIPREDPAVLRLVEAQTALLSNSQAGGPRAAAGGPLAAAVLSPPRTVRRSREAPL